MTSRLNPFCSRPGLRAYSLALAALLALPGLADAQSTNDPAITVQPRDGVAAAGETFGFSVQATGTTALAYQWLFNGSTVSGATNSWLTLTNLTSSNAGGYQVVVTNSAGSVSSTVAQLGLSDAPRAVLTGTVTGGANVTVPVLLSANGREANLTFTLGYQSGIITNPTFQALVTNESVTLINTPGDPARVTVTIELPGDTTFAPGRQEVGRLEFDLVGGADPLQSGLYFTNASTFATNITHDTNGLALVLGALVSPQFEPLTLSPVLNRQSGLFEHQVRVSYPGTIQLTNVNLIVTQLGTDSLTNAIRVYNSIGVQTVGPDENGVSEIAPYVSAGGYAPGESRVLTVEYYVADHFTVPSPVYLLDPTSASGLVVPASAIPLNITTNRYVDGTFIIQFPTRRDYRYFVQYGPTLNDVMNSSTNTRVVNPGINGTGHAVQWIDNGPPKTESLPVNGSRFYRLLEVSID